MAFPHPASLDWALVIGHKVAPCAKGASGDLGREAVRGDMPPLATPATESIWSTCLLEGADLVSASEKSDPTLAETAECCLAEDRGYHRG